MSKIYWVYILKCADDSFYTGYTKNLGRRLREHRNGRGSKYVKGRLPAKLVHVEQYLSRKKAMQREMEIKDMKRDKKKELMKE